MKTNLLCLFFLLGGHFCQTMAEEQQNCEGVPDNCPGDAEHVDTTAGCSVCMPGGYDSVCGILQVDTEEEDTCMPRYLTCQDFISDTGICKYGTESRKDGKSKPKSEDKVNVNIVVNVDK